MLTRFEQGLDPTPEPVEDDSTPSPATALTAEETEAPVTGSRELEFTPSPESALLVPAGTPAPVSEGEEGQALSAGYRCAAWSVFQTGSAGVAAAIALAAAW